MARIHLNIGSNQGNRASAIHRATELIAAQWPDARRICLSPLVESDPWGFESNNKFLNLGVLIDTGECDIADERMATDTLHALQAIEKSICPDSHRDHCGRYIDRTIDIDIVDIEGLVMTTPSLTIPHPRLKERPFFYEPYNYLKNNTPTD